MLDLGSAAFADGLGELAELLDEPGDRRGDAAVAVAVPVGSFDRFLQLAEIHRRDGTALRDIATSVAAMASVHDFEVTDINGEQVSLAEYAGQMLLIVNVASQCGLTPQYAGLRDLHHRFDDVQVLGFPCNQFGAQEPGTEAEICEFVETRYGVDFPMFAKVEVNGPGEAPLYSMLKAAQPGDGEQADITWNFEKFLVDGDGNVVQRFAPGTTPEEVGEVIAGLR